MKILVTGANGRQGRHLVKTLLEQGHWVRGTDLSPDSLLVHNQYEYVAGDLLDGGHTQAIVDGVDAVVHLAGLILYDDDQSRRIIDVNWRATFELLEAMAHNRQTFKRFIYASSGQVYPDNPDGLYLYNPIDETHPLQPVNYYGYAKLASEQLVWFYQRKWSIPGVCFRLAHIQYPHEIIDPNSIYSGPRFFVNRRLQSWQQMKVKSPQIEQAIAIVEAIAESEEKLLLSCGMDGRPFQLVITHPADISQGILLALNSDKAIGQAYNLGYYAPFDFGTAIPYMAEKLNMAFVQANLPLTPYHGVASVAKIRAELGYNPQYDPFRMIDEAITQREEK